MAFVACAILQSGFEPHGAAEDRWLFSKRGKRSSRQRGGPAYFLAQSIARDALFSSRRSPHRFEGISRLSKRFAALLLPSAARGASSKLEANALELAEN